MNKPLAVGIACWFALSVVIFFAACSSDSLSPATTLATIKNQVADDQAKQYWIARRNVVHGNAVDAMVHAQLAAEAYLQAGDEENYRKWKRIARDLPASDDQLLAPKPEPAQNDSLGQLVKQMEQSRNSPPAPYVAPQQPAEAKPMYTVEDKVRMRAEIQKQADDAANKKREVELINIENKQQSRRDAQRAEVKKQQYAAALGGAQLRPWKTLGGQAASRAKIVGYDGGVFTLEKTDGKQIELRESRMMKADKDYCEEWLANAGAD